MVGITAIEKYLMIYSSRLKNKKPLPHQSASQKQNTSIQAVVYFHHKLLLVFLSKQPQQ